MTDKTPIGVVLAYIEETAYRCGSDGTFSAPNVSTNTMYSFDVVKSPPDPPITYRTREEYWEIGEGRSLARITDLGYSQGEVSLELGLQSAIFLYYALGTAVTVGSSPYSHDIYESSLTLPSMAMLYQNNESPSSPAISANNINKIIYGIVVSNITISVEQGAEITMTVDLMSSRTDNLEAGDLLDSTEAPARFTLKVFTYEDFIQAGSYIIYASGTVSAITSGAVTNVTATQISIGSVTMSVGTTTYAVRITSGQGKGQIRVVNAIANATTLSLNTVTDPWIVTPTTSGNTSYATLYDYSPCSTSTSASVTATALIGTSDWTNVDSLDIGITNTLELRPCVGDPYPAKYVVGKREYSLKTHLYPQNHNTLLTLRNTQHIDYTGPIWAKIKFVDATESPTVHAMEFTHTRMYLSDFPDHIPDWDEVIVGIDMEFRNAPDDEFTINTTDNLVAGQY